MEILKWREGYETGIEAMDNQHKYLIHLINQMYTILREKEGLEALDTVLAEMSDYAEQHFHDEEDILLKHAYPVLPINKRPIAVIKGKLRNCLPKNRWTIWLHLRIFMHSCVSGGLAIYPMTTNNMAFF